jgi:hypothetical protein
MKTGDLILYHHESSATNFFGYIEEYDSKYDVYKVFWFDYKVLPSVFYDAITTYGFIKQFLEWRKYHYESKRKSQNW